MSCCNDPRNEPVRILIVGGANSHARRMIERAASHMIETIELIYEDTSTRPDNDITITGPGANVIIIDDPRPLEAAVLHLPCIPPATAFTALSFDARFQDPLPEFKPTCYAPKGKQTKAKKSFTCTGRIRGNYY